MKLGFDPSKSVFVEAVRAFHFMSHKTWEHKTEVYGRFGLSEDEIWSMFRKRPNCLSLSEKKITGVMNFLVCKMGWQAAVVARVPSILCLSLEKRIMPRCSVESRVVESKFRAVSDPNYEILKTILISDEKVVNTLNRMENRSLCSFQKTFSNNLSFLRGLGISQSSISYLVIQSPSVMCQKVRKFAEVVKKVMNLGFDPSKSVFVEAVRAFISCRQNMGTQNGGLWEVRFV
ncbi:hypothetical protein GH714_005863 [Hevea brasiliensis]|uniref:Uncharacterized protein n=1 Tax=Hevea brasiliensis TaxID=3981 RepID=A0A6A6N784_HEVBR|nr:hypothetical protein GH714_005863 [Hevea brasiliensis]